MSAHPRTHGRRGYTLIEVALAAAFIPLLVGAAAKVVSSSGGLAEESRAALHAHEELRKNLESVANVVRTADIDTFDGFDTNGMATAPTFACVCGATEMGRVYGGAEQLEWRAVGDVVHGVERPGAIVHTKDGKERVVARNVPLGGFNVRFEGGTLVIRMSAYYLTTSRKLAQVWAETAVALRN